MEEEVSTPNQKLFIGGLAWAATDEDLKAAFEKFGEVVSASVVRYPDTGRSKGFGFVEFSTVEEAVEAQAKMDGQEIAGRAIKVDFSRPSTGKRER